MAHLIRPLIRLDGKNEDIYKQLIFDNSYILAITEDHSYEEILVGVIRREPRDRWEERRKDFIALLEALDLSQIADRQPES